MHDKKLALSATILFLTLLMSACIAPPSALSSMTEPSDKETLFQISTLDALLAGVYEGALTIGELKHHGDFGLGTFDALNGEMVVADGQVYRVDDQGIVHVADDAATTPFAAVTYFEPDGTVALSDPFTCEQLQSYLDARLPSANVPYAIRVRGDFADLTVRSVPKQQAPYPPLADALAEQVVFEQQDISGDMIGFRLPQYLAGANVAGYHFHFLSTDRQVGGHVLDCEAGEVTVAFDAIEMVQMAVPQTAGFQNAATPDAADAGADTAPLVVSRGDSRPPVSINDIVIGALYNLSGEQSGLDGPSAQGAALAVDEVNAGGGIGGHAVHLAIADGESDPTVLAAETADILAQYANMSAFMGLSDTDMVLAAAPVAAAAERLFLTSGATSPRLPEQIPGYLFMACFGDNVQAAAGAEWAYDILDARTVSILYEADNTYTQLLQGYFRTRFEALGGEVATVESFTSGDAADLSAAVTRLQSADLIYLAATPDDALPGVLALREAGHTVPILGGDGFDVTGLWADQPDVSQVFFTTHAYLGGDNDDPLVVAFREAYTQAYPDAVPDAFAALGYDAANLLIEAIRQAESSEPGAVRQALAGIRQFDGVTGQLGFLPGGQIPVKSVSILGVDAGSVQLIEQVMPEQVPAP